MEGIVARARIDRGGDVRADRTETGIIAHAEAHRGLDLPEIGAEVAPGHPAVDEGDDTDDQDDDFDY